MAQFRDLSDFNEWVEYFDRDNRARGGAPMIIEAEVHGLGFTLACNFLKELGYVNFGKPDIHIKKIFAGIGLSQSEDKYQVFKSMGRVADSTGRTVYDVDKVFWLVGSGWFYRTGLRVKTDRNEFIKAARKTLGESA